MALTLPIVILPIFTFGLISSERVQTISKQNIDKNITAHSSQLNRLINSTISVGQSNLSLFSKHAAITRYALASEDERYNLLQPIIFETLKSFNEAYPEYYEIRFVLPDGFEDVRFSTNPENLTEEELEHPVIQKLNKEDLESVSLFTTNPDNNEFTLYFARKLLLTDFAKESFGAKPTLRGFLILTTSLANIQQELDRMESNLNVEFALLDQTPHSRLISQAKKNQTSYGEIFSNNAFKETIKNLKVSNESPKSNTQFEFFYNGKEYQINQQNLDNGFKLLSAFPTALYLSEGKNVQNTLFFTTFLAIFILVVFLISGLKRFVLSPIRLLTNAIKQVEDHKATVQIAVKTDDEFGQLARSFEVMNSKLIKSSKKLKTQAFTDSLTGLPNRLMFQDYLERLLLHSGKVNGKFALLFIDLDDFKEVNDSLGHNTGDLLLKKIANRLQNSLRLQFEFNQDFYSEQNDFIARLGGDEFIIILHDVKNNDSIRNVADRVISDLSKPIMLNDYEHHGSSSIGISIYPDNAVRAEDLIKNADLAMYQSKKSGKNFYQFYTKELGEKQEEINKLEIALRKSIQTKNGLKLFYQPKISLSSFRIIGFEALIRWTLDDGVSINPEKLIEVAEKRELIIPLTDWIVNEACCQNAFWQTKKIIKAPIAVNFAGSHIVREDISEMIMSSLKKHKLDPNDFEVEMTESSVIDTSKIILERLKRIRELGIDISVDDFGTGFSSLSYLSNFPVNNVKIDRAFIKKINIDNHSAIVTAIINMAHALGHKVVAEGVETEEQLEFLHSQKCDIVQGYLFSKPLPADEIEKFVLNFKEFVKKYETQPNKPKKVLL